MQEPLISVIIITYNHSKFIVDALNSIKMQTYNNIELIISDDFSTDNTLDVCRNWIKNNKEHFIRTEIVTSPRNTGVAANCNRGLKKARGEWIKFLSGDDALLPDCIKSYVNYINNNPEVLFIHSNVIPYSDTFSVENKLPISYLSKLRLNKEETSAREQYKILLHFNNIQASTVMIHKSVFKRVGEFEESITYYEDYPMWLKITKNNIKLYYLDSISAKYRIHKNSLVKYKGKFESISDRTFNIQLIYRKYYYPLLPVNEKIYYSILFLIIIVLKLFSIICKEFNIDANSNLIYPFIWLIRNSYNKLKIIFYHKYI